MENIKKIPLPLLILIICVAIGLVVAGIGLIKQGAAKKTNEQRYQEAYKLALENKEKLEKRYDEITEELKPLKEQIETKQQQCDSLNMSDPNWFADKTKCQREVQEINSQITELETEQWQIENYDNTVYYDLVKPMSYQIFYIIGGAIAGLGALGAFIIYLVKGKKSY